MNRPFPLFVARGDLTIDAVFCSCVSALSDDCSMFTLTDTESAPKNAQEGPSTMRMTCPDMPILCELYICGIVQTSERASPSASRTHSCRRAIMSTELHRCPGWYFQRQQGKQGSNISLTEREYFTELDETCVTDRVTCKHFTSNCIMRASLTHW